MLVTEVVDELPVAAPEERARLVERAGDAAVHAAALGRLGGLNALEVRPPGPAGSVVAAPGRLRVAAWNVERGRDPGAIAGLLAAQGVDVALLTELDVGMARTGQRHTAREIAGGLGHGYAFGVEFCELGLGDAGEQEALAGRVNERGWHGNAVLTALELRRPVVVRLDTDGAWFTEAWRGELRVGGRMAVVATVPWAEGELVVCAVHLESHGDPPGRAAQLECLLDEVDRYAGDRPVVVGGDLNTFSAAGVEVYSSRLRRALAESDPHRFDDPVAYEPLFAVAARHGFRWDGANAAGPTQRTGASGSPRPPLMRLDWLLVRGVDVAAPATVAAVGPDGTVLSDHDLVVATIG